MNTENAGDKNDEMITETDRLPKWCMDSMMEAIEELNGIGQLLGALADYQDNHLENAALILQRRVSLVENGLRGILNGEPFER